MILQSAMFISYQFEDVDIWMCVRNLPIVAVLDDLALFLFIIVSAMPVSLPYLCITVGQSTVTFPPFSLIFPLE